MLKNWMINSISAALLSVGLSAPIMASPSSDAFSYPNTEMPSEIYRNLLTVEPPSVNSFSPPSSISSSLSKLQLTSTHLHSKLLPAMNVALIVRMIFEGVVWVLWHEKS